MRKRLHIYKNNTFTNTYIIEVIEFKLQTIKRKLEKDDFKSFALSTLYKCTYNLEIYKYFFDEFLSHTFFFIGFLLHPTVEDSRCLTFTREFLHPLGLLA
ncbi:hypothetical protein EUTSA_v10005392mg [Eutrema salsugineum]|uniref:Uncharacterized protein n=1 Tax=Eutrema salsugineum TaxID=72664 RepID=V4K4Y6_EUTSA|nr:hypothetical protein EUTSA_v10005392mg [Eutrema salsugineum]